RLTGSPHHAYYSISQTCQGNGCREDYNKRTSKQQNGLRVINNTTTKTNGKYPYPATRPPQSCRLLDWISLKDPPNIAIPNSDDLFATLQEMHKLQDCIVIARGRPQDIMPSSKYPIINQPLEWRSSKGREEFLASELSLRLNEALAYRSWSQEAAWLIPNKGVVIRANPLFPPQKLYEVLTIYFPADLDQEAISSIEKFRWLPNWYFGEEYDAHYPVESQKPAWIEGTYEYKGQTARRLAYFIRLVDEERERIYEEKGKYNVIVDFFDGLKDLGMIGYESLHVEFVEVVHYVPKNYVPEPPRPISPEGRKFLDSLPAYDSDISL
ncbi:uncharacterized protein N7496_006546, partial [Penicillium cataractarum]